MRRAARGGAAEVEMPASLNTSDLLFPPVGRVALGFAPPLLASSPALNSPIRTTAAVRGSCAQPRPLYPSVDTVHPLVYIGPMIEILKTQVYRVVREAARPPGEAADSGKDRLLGGWRHRQSQTPHEQGERTQDRSRPRLPRVLHAARGGCRRSAVWRRQEHAGC